LYKELVTKDKNYIYSGLREYAVTAMIMETESFTIRIDVLDDETFRYAAWEKGKPMSSKPSLILSKGTRIVEGSAHVSTYTFKNGNYTYQCVDDFLPSLTVYKNDEEILYQEAISVDF
jgi:hypothetical protein